MTKKKKKKVDNGLYALIHIHKFVRNYTRMLIESRVATARVGEAELVAPLFFEGMTSRGGARREGKRRTNRDTAREVGALGGSLQLRITMCK